MKTNTAQPATENSDGALDHPRSGHQLAPTEHNQPHPASHSSLITRHSSRLTPHPSQTTPDASTLYPSSFTFYVLRFTPHASRLTDDIARLTRHSSLITRYVSRLFLILGLLFTGLGGAFAPWVWRAPVALQLTGPGLAEFVKFLPEIRLDQIHIQRLYFLLPLFLAMLLLPLVAENRILALPTWLRRLLRLLVLPLALAALSPVWTPAILMAPEFRLQTLLAATALGLAIIAPLLRGLPFKLLVALLTIGGLAAIILPMWHFRLIQAPLSAVYNEPVNWGWGWWLTMSGVIMSILGSIGTVRTAEME